MKRLLINNTKTTLQKSRKNYEDSILHYVLLALAAMNFLGYGDYVVLLWGAYAFLRYIAVDRKLRVRADHMLILLMSISFLLPACIYVSMFKLVEVARSINYVAMFVIGYNGYFAANNKEKYIKRTIATLFIGFAVYLALLLIVNHQNGTFTPSKIDLDYAFNSSEERMAFDIWTGSRIAVTCVGLLGAVVVGGFFYAFVCVKNIFIKMGALLSIGVVFVINFITATRTPIILFAVVVPIMMFLYTLNSDKKAAAKFVVAVILILCACLIAYEIDLFGIQTYISSTPIFERFLESGIGTDRSDISLMHYRLMFDYLWGGNNIHRETHIMAHNFIQEGHDLYGIFATVFLLVLTVRILWVMARLSFIKKKSSIVFLLLGTLIAMFLQCCVEPVLEGYAFLFASMILVYGLSVAYLQDLRKQKPKGESDDDCSN